MNLKGIFNPFGLGVSPMGIYDAIQSNDSVLPQGSDIGNVTATAAPKRGLAVGPGGSA